MGCCQAIPQDKYLQKFTPQTPQSPEQDINNLFLIIRKQIQQFAVYDTLVSKYRILEMMDLREQLYLNNQFSLQLLELILEYMALCRNAYRNDKHRLRTLFNQQNFAKQISERWYQIYLKAIDKNRSTLRILNYICKVKRLALNYHDHSFLDLKFDLSKEQTIKVFSVIRNLCYYDVRNFCFLTNYLIKSCYQLSNSKKFSLIQIETKLKAVLKILPHQIILDQISEEESTEQMNQHSNFSIQDKNISYKVLKLDGIEDNIRQKEIQKVFIQLHEQTLDNFKNINNFIEDLCLKNQGYNFKAETHFNSRTLKTSLLEQKLKIDHKIVNKNLIQEYLKQKNINSINDKIKQEFELVEQVVKDHYKKIGGQIRFKNVNISLKCVFGSITKMNKCCKQMKDAILKNKQFITLISLQNRLKDQQSPSISLKIKYNNLIVQIDLLFDLNVLNNHLINQIKQLIEHQAFSILQSITFLNQKLSLSYLKQLQCTIKANIQSIKKYNYEQIIQYSSIGSSFSQFVNLLPVNLPQQMINMNVQDYQLKLLYKKLKSIQQFGNLRQKIEDCQYKSLNNGTFYFYKKNYDRSIENIEDFISKEQQIKKTTIQTSINKQNAQININSSSKYIQGLKLLAESYRQKQDYTKSLIIYSKLSTLENKIYGKHSIEFLLSQKKIAVISKKLNVQKSIQNLKGLAQIQQQHRGKQTNFNLQILQEIGLAYRQVNNYNESLKYYFKAIILSDQLNGLQNIGVALHLNNIGLIYYTQGYSNEALKYYLRSIDIYQKNKGFYNFQSASILNNIGSIYFNQNKYPQALKYYFKSLDIKEKIKGKLNLDFALTLNNIGSVYKNQDKLQEALKYFELSLFIKQKLKGPESIEVALILNNIGSVYKHQKKYEQAIQAYQKCLSIKQKVKGKQNEDCASVLYSIGNVYKNQKKIELALKYFLKAQQLVEKYKIKQSFTKKLLDSIAKCNKTSNNSIESDNSPVKSRLNESNN